jgi:hypothetical protein
MPTENPTPDHKGFVVRPSATHFHFLSFTYGAISAAVLVFLLLNSTLMTPPLDHPISQPSTSPLPTPAPQSAHTAQPEAPTNSWDLAVKVAWKQITDEGLQHHPYSEVCETFGLTSSMSYYCTKTRLSPDMLTRAELTDIAVYSIAGLAHAPEGTPRKDAIIDGIDELLRRKPVPQDTTAVRTDQKRRADGAKAQSDAYRARHQARIPE